MQRADLVPLPLLGDDYIPAIWAVCWYLINFFPLDLVSRLFGSFAPLRILAAVGLSGLRAGIIVQRADLIRALYPGTRVGPAVMGLLGASGGTFLVDMIEISGGYRAGTSACVVEGDSIPDEAYGAGAAEFSAPGFSLWSGLLPGISHVVLVHELGLLSSKAHQGFWIVVFVGHTVAGILGLALDWTKPFRYLFHALTRIPDPLVAGVQHTSATKNARKQQHDVKASAAQTPATPAAKAPAARTPAKARPAAPVAPPAASAAAPPQTPPRPKSRAAAAAAAKAAAAQVEPTTPLPASPAASSAGPAHSTRSATASSRHDDDVDLAGEFQTPKTRASRRRRT